MALIKCPECEKQISDQATNCPNCGYPIAKRISLISSLTSEIEQIKVQKVRGVSEGNPATERNSVALGEKNNPPYSPPRSRSNIGCAFSIAGLLSGIVLIIIGISQGDDSSLFYLGFTIVFGAVFITALIARLSMSPEEVKVADNIRRSSEHQKQIGVISGVMPDCSEIAYTQIVSSDSKKSLGSAVVRGAVGNMVAGPIGVVAGAATAKNKGTTTFLVEKKDGTRLNVVVKTNGIAFNDLCKHLK